MLISDCSSLRERRGIGMTFENFCNFTEKNEIYSNGRLCSKFINPLSLSQPSFLYQMNSYLSSFIPCSSLKVVHVDDVCRRRRRFASHTADKERMNHDERFVKISIRPHNSAFSKALLINLYLNSHSRVLVQRKRDFSVKLFYSTHSFCNFLLRTFFMLPHHSLNG